jgi:hypothetical protein
MAGVAATAFGARSDSDSVLGAATTTEGPAAANHAGTGRFTQPGSPSRRAERAWARAEYDHYQWMRERYEQQGGPNGGPGKPTSPNFSRVVDAVKKFGVDPSGSRPINEDINSIPEDTLVVFPPGRYLLDGKLNVDGTKIGMVGAGYQNNSPPSGKKTAALVAAEGTRGEVHFDAKTGMFGNFVFDQTASGASMGLYAGSSGFVQYRDVIYEGVVEPVGSPSVDMGKQMVAIQAQKGATARCTRFVMKYNGLPGTKNIGAGSAFWLGTTHHGTGQIEDCTVVGNASNGVYGGRTPGTGQIKGGLWRNNAVSQNRLSGAKSWSDGVTIEIDAKNYKGPTGNYGGFNQKIGTSGIQIERGDNGISKPSGAEVRNADIRIRSTGKSGLRAGIGVLGSGGGLKISNTRIIVQVDRPAVTAESPGGGYSGASAPPPHTITMTDSLLGGTNANPTIRVSGRENSLIRNTCLKIPGASQDSISGMKIGSGVGFGKQCKAGGLKAPKKVGSGGNLSAVNFSAANASVGNGSAGAGASNRRRKQRQKTIFTAVTSGIFFILFLIFGMFVVFVGGGMALLGGLAALLGGD